jgi:hypothetical protein
MRTRDSRTLQSRRVDQTSAPLIVEVCKKNAAKEKIFIDLSDRMIYSQCNNNWDS